MTDLGGDTRDLRALRQPHPAERGLAPEDLEDATRRFGRRCRRWGLGTLGAAGTAALIIAIVADLRLFRTPAGMLFAVVGLFAIISGATIITAFGFAERLHRPMRTLLRKSISGDQRRGQRLDRIETAIKDIADQMPEALHLADWRGYAKALREDPNSSATGTDGVGHRRGHLDLVQRDMKPRD